METSKVIELAIQKNLCEPWQKKMKNNSSVENLCKMYFDGDDWSMENDFPDIEMLREFKGETEIHGLFTDYVGMPNMMGKMAFFGDSEVRLTYDGYTVSQLILRHQTKAKVTVSENAILIINLLDYVELEIESYDNSRVEIFSYSNENIKSFGDVRITKSSFKK